jgi:hypothetical protein
VRVDGLVWRVKSARMTKGLGPMGFGLNVKAKGMFVAVKLGVHSKKDENATLSDNAVKLSIGGDTYDADTAGTTAAAYESGLAFFADTVGPGANKTGMVAFDVPKAKLTGKMEMQFGEPGPGSTHGYIQLPALG